jgi:hypothetical protein
MNLARRQPLTVDEILVPSSVHMDTSAKLIGYFKLDSVRHDLVIEPDKQSVTHHRRTNDGKISSVAATSGILTFDPPGPAIDVGAQFG